MCEALSDDSNNHVVNASASGHNKYVSTKASLGMVFMFFFVYVCLCLNLLVVGSIVVFQWVLLKAKCK
jgi:uncharacterized membrane protein SpoIIM required for sporulation